MGGNKYRLVARVDCEEEVPYIETVMTHEECGREDLWCLETHEQLLAESVPQVIESDKQYREIGARFGNLVGKARARTRSETKLMRLLALLIEDYDRRNALPPADAGPAVRLRFLLEHSGKATADLISIFG